MSMLGFEVHMDKENTTPAPFVNKGRGLTSFGPRDKGKLVQPTPRKALFDVNNKPANIGLIRGLGVKDIGSTNLCKETVSKPLKTPLVIASDTENTTLAFQSKKADSKKTPLLQKKGPKICKTHDPNSSNKSVRTKRKLLPAPSKQSLEPEINEEEYDSDSIFPKADRLSSYVDKLLAWRPPCLFGSIPDSEPEESDWENVPEDDLILDMPLSLATVPEFSDSDLANLMGDLPLPPVSGIDESESGVPAVEADLSLNSTDMSFSLGSLHVMHESLDNSNLKYMDELDTDATPE